MRKTYINFQQLSCFDPAGGGATLNPGTSPNQTLRWDGSAWQPSSNILNNDTNTAIGGAIQTGLRLTLTGSSSSGSNTTLALANQTEQYSRFQDNEAFFLYGKQHLYDPSQSHTWADLNASALLFSSFGAIPDTDATHSNMFIFNGKSTGSSAITFKSYTGNFIQIQNTATSTTTNNVIGADIASRQDATGGTVSNLIGMRVATAGAGAGSNITNAYVIRARLNQQNATITNHYGLYIENPSGTATNVYGLYIDGLTGTNKWGIYQADPGATNLFAGPTQWNGQTGVAPTSGTFVSVPLAYYGNANDHVLATPDKWLKINLDGVVHSIPAYI